MKQKHVFFSLLLVSLLSVTILSLGCGQKMPSSSFDTATIASLNKIMTDARASSSAEGIMLGVWAPGKGEYLAVNGTSEITTRSAMDTTKLYRIGSLTKTFTTTVALQLVDEGLISLDDTVDKYITGVPSGDVITLKMLFNHTSGLPNYTTSVPFWETFITDRHHVFTPQDLLDLAFVLPMTSAPGAEYHYSNTNTTILGMIIEKVNPQHETLAQAVTRRVIKKIGLQHTTFATLETFPEPYIHGYQMNAIPEEWDIYNPSWMWAAGAIISNMSDLRTYIKSIVENNASLLSSSMQTRRLNDDFVGIAAGYPGLQYGLGWARYGGFYWHDGATYGYHNIAAYDPTTGTTVVAIMNTEPTDGTACLSILVNVIKLIYPTRVF